MQDVWRADSTCKFHNCSNQSGEPRESHDESQPDEQTEICARGGLIFYPALRRVYEVGAPGKKDDVQRHDDAQWSNDEKEERGGATEPAVDLAVSRPEVRVEAGELDDESWYHDKNWHDPAKHRIHTEALPFRA